MPTRSAAGTAALLLAVLAGAGHLGVGYFYLVSGLVVPVPALLPLWLLWGLLAVWLVRLALRRSWWTPGVPVLAAGVLVLVLVVGDEVLGWQA
ncbi:hypothetical protein ACI79C_13015 [Geodermatophilus sp. SYSU D00697]